MADLHHVGYVVTTPLETALETWRRTLQATSVSAIFDDPIQRVRVAFLHFPTGSQVELVEPAGADSPVQAFAAKGGGLHHVCFEVDDLDQHMAQMRAQKVALVRRPHPAVAFGGRRIGWMMTPERLLIEYLERSRP